MNEVTANAMSERHWYVPFCTKDEIDRILSPQNARDFLLQERANIVADHARYLRVYRNKAAIYKDWSFEKSFNDKHYLDVLSRLSPEDYALCKDITFGDVFSNDVNGYARKEPAWGRIICLNESLQFFMKFCNLAILDFDEEIPFNVRFNALRIAMRVMLKTEAMDFFMDPRGIVPEEVGIKMHTPINYELQFIAGHEFAHHMCGHLDDKNLCSRAVLKTEEKEYFAPVYTIPQKQEFEADIASLTRPHYLPEEKSKLIEGALLWFISLEISEKVQETINPMLSWSLKTHPSASDRIEHILKEVDLPEEVNLKKMEKIRKNASMMGELLVEDIANNFEAYEAYGSAYLDAPNTKWRGRELIDRVDY